MSGQFLTDIQNMWIPRWLKQRLGLSWIWAQTFSMIQKACHSLRPNVSDLKMWKTVIKFYQNYSSIFIIFISCIWYRTRFNNIYQIFFNGKNVMIGLIAYKIWLNFMAQYLVFSALMQFSIFFRISNFFGLSTTKET
jgi:hypothetical protein